MRTTDFCPECARPTEDDGAAAVRSGLPPLRGVSQREEANRWINVARVTNLAEAGFLVDELAGECDRRADLSIGGFQRTHGPLAW